MAGDQGSSKPRRSNTGEFDEGSLDGVPICLALAKTTAAGKSEIRRRRKSASVTNRILREERGNASYTGGGRHHPPEPKRGDVE
jgi:hypothetical protein